MQAPYTACSRLFTTVLGFLMCVMCTWVCRFFAFIQDHASDALLQNQGGIQFFPIVFFKSAHAMNRIQSECIKCRRCNLTLTYCNTFTHTKINHSYTKFTQIYCATFSVKFSIKNRGPHEKWWLTRFTYKTDNSAYHSAYNSSYLNAHLSSLCALFVFCFGLPCHLSLYTANIFVGNVVNKNFKTVLIWPRDGIQKCE